jgi:hypothetical protein
MLVAGRGETSGTILPSIIRRLGQELSQSQELAKHATGAEFVSQPAKNYVGCPHNGEGNNGGGRDDFGCGDNGGGSADSAGSGSGGGGGCSVRDVLTWYCDLHSHQPELCCTCLPTTAVTIWKGLCF